jgi:hypothetical protein
MKKLGLATALLLAMTGAQAYQFEIKVSLKLYLMLKAEILIITLLVDKQLTTSKM